MGRSLGEEIAVLDGLDGFASADGRIGRRPATGAEYALRKRHNYETRRNVIDPSEGANYSGGSDYAPGLPLGPSSWGLADSDLVNYSKVTNVLPPKRKVIDPSGGANYTGGSNYGPGMPLVVSGDPGLAALMNPDSYADFAQLDPSVPTIKGGYGSAGLGAARFAPGGGSDYGRAGLGEGHRSSYSPYPGVGLSELDAAFGSSLEIEDGRIGRRPATASQYASRVSHNFQTRRNVIDPSEGANYSGGSDYAPGLPLGPSSWGLAGLGRADAYGDFNGLQELSMVDGLDGLEDLAFYGKFRAAFQRQAFKRVAGKKRLNRILRSVRKIKGAWRTMTPVQKLTARRKLARAGGMLRSIRRIRRNVLRSATAQGGAPLRYRARSPWSPPKSASTSRWAFRG
jgi:hypothetical protein